VTLLETGELMFDSWTGCPPLEASDCPLQVEGSGGSGIRMRGVGGTMCSGG
jgi:hypothetical protein